MNVSTPGCLLGEGSHFGRFLSSSQVLLKQTKDRKINLWRARSPGLGFPNVSPHHRKTKDWWSDTSPTWRFGSGSNHRSFPRLVSKDENGNQICGNHLTSSDYFQTVICFFGTQDDLESCQHSCSSIGSYGGFRTWRSTALSGAWHLPVVLGCLWHLFVNQSRISFPLKLGNKNGTSTSMNLILLLSNLYLYIL